MSSCTPSIKGGTYKPTITYYPDADNPDQKLEIEDDQIFQAAMALFGEKQDIESVCMYRNKLFKQIWSQVFCFHAFVFVRTRDSFWTFEKNSMGVIVQRSKSHKKVLDFLEGKRRIGPVTLVNIARGKTSVGSLFRKLYTHNVVRTRYNFMSCNCKHFAEKVFAISCSNEVECRTGLCQMLTHPLEAKGQLCFFLLRDGAAGKPETKKFDDKNDFLKGLCQQVNLKEGVVVMVRKVFDGDVNKTFVQLKTENQKEFCISGSSEGKEKASIATIQVDFCKIGSLQKKEECVCNLKLNSILEHVINIAEKKHDQQHFVEEIFNYCKKKVEKEF